MQMLLEKNKSQFIYHEQNYLFSVQTRAVNTAEWGRRKQFHLLKMSPFSQIELVT